MLAQRLLLNLVVAALAQAPTPAALVTRQRVRPLPEGLASCASVRLEKARGATRYMGSATPMQWRTQLVVECIARTNSASAPDEAVEPVLSAVHQRLVNDPGLRDAGFTLEPQVDLQWDQAEADDRVGAVLLAYTVLHTTTANLAAA